MLERQLEELRALAASIPKERERTATRPTSGACAQVVGHLVDGERVFGYRAFCIQPRASRRRCRRSTRTSTWRARATTRCRSVSSSTSSSRCARRTWRSLRRLAAGGVGPGRHGERQAGQRAGARVRHGRPPAAPRRRPARAVRRRLSRGATCRDARGEFRVAGPVCYPSAPTHGGVMQLRTPVAVVLAALVAGSEPGTHGGCEGRRPRALHEVRVPHPDARRREALHRRLRPEGRRRGSAIRSC